VGGGTWLQRGGRYIGFVAIQVLMMYDSGWLCSICSLL
jgi:hypothetical protein